MVWAGHIITKWDIEEKDLIQCIQNWLFGDDEDTYRLAVMEIMKDLVMTLFTVSRPNKPKTDGDSEKAQRNRSDQSHYSSGQRCR